MPRGVYDRSKTTAQRASEKKAAAKGTPGRKPGRKPAAVVADAPKTRTKSAHVDASQFGIVRDNISALASAVQGLEDRSNMAPVVSKLNVELVANLEILSNLRRDHFGLTAEEQSVQDKKDAEEKAALEAQSESESEEDDEEVVAPAAPYPTQPLGTVPMPPVLPSLSQ